MEQEIYFIKRANFEICTTKPPVKLIPTEETEYKDVQTRLLGTAEKQ